MKKYFIWSFALLYLLFTPLTSLAQDTAVSGSFIDITGHWAKEDIESVCKLGLMNGTEINRQGLRTFSPEEGLTWAQLASVLMRTFHLDLDPQAYTNQPRLSDYCQDVDEQAWYAEAVLLCTINQIFTGQDNFRPDREVTRMELAQSIYHCFRAKDINIPVIMMMPTYSDIQSLSHQDINIIAFVSNTGIMKGYGQEFRPQQAVKRAELASVIYRCALILELNQNTNIEVDDAYNGKTLTLPVGETFMLSLQGNPSSGYEWSMDNGNDEVLLTTLDKGFKTQQSSDLLGQIGKFYWKFKALQPGSTHIKLVYARPWESVQPLKTYQLQVEITPREQPSPSVIVDIKEIKEQLEYESVDLNVPVLTGLENTEAQTAFNCLLEQDAMDWKEEVESGLDEYIEGTVEAGFPIRPYQLVSRVQVCNQNQKVLSFYVDYYQYTGGAHGLTTRKAYNLDIKNGKILTFKDLFQEDYNYKAVLNEKIKNEINAHSEDYFSGNLGFTGINDEQGFYIQDENLVLYFGQYEIAPYAAGIPEFKIPLADLVNGLSPDLIP